MKYAKQIKQLGTETAFAVSAQAKDWASKGNKVYPFHLGDLNMKTPPNIVEATMKAIGDGKTGYCPSEGILSLREALITSKTSIPSSIIFFPSSAIPLFKL